MKVLYSLALFFSIQSLCAVQFNKVIIWGHKLHSHTHSYIHDAFYKAFKELGYETYWFDNNDNVAGFDFENCLFLTEGQVDQRMPYIASSYYLLHNVEQKKNKPLYDAGHAITFQVYTHRCQDQHDDIKKVDSCIYSSKSGKTIYIPWATDLLPAQIDTIKEQVIRDWGKPKEKAIYWVGSIYGGYHGNEEQNKPFKACLC